MTTDRPPRRIGASPDPSAAADTDRATYPEFRRVAMVAKPDLGKQSWPPVLALVHRAFGSSASSALTSVPMATDPAHAARQPAGCADDLKSNLLDLVHRHTREIIGVGMNTDDRRTEIDGSQRVVIMTPARAASS